MNGDDNVVDFRRGPGGGRRDIRTRGRDWANTPERTQALTVPCRACGAREGVLCTTEFGTVLTRFPAHPARMSDARKAATNA